MYNLNQVCRGQGVDIIHNNGYNGDSYQLFEIGKLQQV
jgi:hypothetical protein